MQILPTSPNGALDGLMAANGASSSQGQGTTSFSQLFARHAEASPAEVTPIVTPHAIGSDAEKNAQSGKDTTTEAPYGENATPVGVAGIRLTPKELKQVLDNLTKQGADQETLSKVAALMANPLGVTVDSLIKVLAGQQAAKLTESDLSRIESLGNTIDPSGKLAASLLDDLRNGRTSKAWSDFSQALQQADPGSVFHVDKNDVLSFGKALGLGQGTLSALEKTFQGQEGGQFSLEGMQRLLVPAQQEMVNRMASHDKLAQQLETALGPVIREAQKRLAAAESASQKESRQVQHSRTLIEDSMTEKGFTRQTEAQLAGAKVAGQTDLADAALAQVHGMGQRQGTDEAGQNGQGASGQNGPNGQGGQGGQGGKDAQLLDKRNAQLTSLRDEKAGEKAASPWDALVQRLSAQGTHGVLSNPAVTNNPATQNLQHLQNSAAVLPDQRSRMTEQMLAQVEQGVLTGFRDGSKTLQLQLNPVELGALTVLLTSRNGEVSATLRPERGETAIMLAQQTDQLKATLEQQGLKVDKVEVQTQLKDNQNTGQWQGMDQHNASQEQKARNDELERIRRLTRMGRISDSAADLARSARMAPPPHMGTMDGLHLVA